MNRYKLILVLFSNLVLSQKMEMSKPNCLLEKENNTVLLKKNKIKMKEKNVFGKDLEIASLNPLTGFYRNGYCSTGIEDSGVHVVAAVMTNEFLNYSKSKGNDLITPNLKYGFPGLKAGDVWCLCANRWKEAFKFGVAPPVILEATNKKALEIVSIDELKINSVK